MNLNFYTPHHAGNLQNMQSALQEQMEKLEQLRTMDFSNNVKVQPMQPQRYYLDCGCKEDWQEFLRINYNITENQIFEDYKLFLQAKAELSEDMNKQKLQNMKEKLSPKSVQKKEFNENIINQNNVPAPLPQDSLPITQQVSMQNMGQQVNAANITANSNQNINTNNGSQLEKNRNYNEQKGVKHVR